MISEKLQNAINEQITAEMWSANLYLAMSFYFEWFCSLDEKAIPGRNGTCLCNGRLYHQTWRNC